MTRAVIDQFGLHFDTLVEGSIDTWQAVPEPAGLTAFATLAALAGLAVRVAQRRSKILAS